ncbi:MAG TPA: FHA domain-containing protein [Vicinamibacterales bacterium]|nr:FHA domain-containing protein [Vicinamibacterales bacterium]
MVVRFGSFALAADSRRLTRAGEDLHLTPKAFDLLMLLADAAPRVVPKAELHARLWPDSFVADTTLVGLVKEVRRVLSDTDAAAPVIRTVARVGYALAAPVHPAGPQPSNTRHWLVADGRSFPLTTGTNIVGREPAAGVWLDSGSVSRRHASIEVASDQARIEDLGSKNGTTVNGRAIREPAVLADGDRLIVGTVPLTYRTSATALSTETRGGAINAGRASALESGQPLSAPARPSRPESA